MMAIMIADKLVSISRMIIFSVIISLPLNAQAEYYLVYGTPVVPVCDYCQGPRVYYRTVHKVKPCKHKKVYKKYYRKAVHRRSYSHVAVYYPVAIYQQPSCGCCGCAGFIEPTYYWAPAPYRVYYAHPSDRLVANRYEDSWRDPSLDTGTADNDIY